MSEPLMRQGSSYDAIVVGASIAGCTAATLLGRAGLPVALLEPHTAATSYKVVCARFIQPSATPVIERLGLVERIEADGGVRNDIQSWSRYGWFQPPLGPGYRNPRFGYDIRREKLDPILRELAAQTPGVDLLPGQTVTSLVRANGRPESAARTGSTPSTS